jgi:hypothetical protein
LREVESASEQIAAKYSSDEYLLSASRTSDFETKNIVPNIHKLYAFAAVYDLDFSELLKWYGVNLSELRNDSELTPNLVTHRTRSSLANYLRIPVRLDPAFDPLRTSNFARFIQEWGSVPAAYIDQLSTTPFTYVRIGSADLTMYPLVMPGSFVQVDESKGYVGGKWRSEYERPIYLVETRDELVCCWCEIQGSKIVLQSHPLSQVPVRLLNYPQEAEILGMVIGIAMSFAHLERGPSEVGR